MRSFTFAGKKYQVFDGEGYNDLMLKLTGARFTPCNTSDLIRLVLTGPERIVKSLFGRLQGFDTCDGAGYRRENGRDKFKIDLDSRFLIEPDSEREIISQGDTLLSLTFEEYKKIKGPEFSKLNMTGEHSDEEDYEIKPTSIESKIWFILTRKKFKLPRIAKVAARYIKIAEEDGDSFSRPLDVAVRGLHGADIYSSMMGAFYLGSFEDGFHLDCMRISNEARLLGYKKK